MKILFVCLGNICRSPAAEAVMLHTLREAGLHERVRIDSAGTGDWHVGELADPRMRTCGRERGYNLQSRARQIRPDDLRSFDLIITMDSRNYQAVKAMAVSDQEARKVRSFASFCSASDCAEVPDPYFGGPEGFEVVLDILEDGCKGLLTTIRETLAGSSSS